ncbi:hypothetical protein BT69DRAFT_1348044 [Atractiella rhizophila]|nr:hypothetical protein BT69DRAFT_1348044 [Atractiella rhizophila]
MKTLEICPTTTTHSAPILLQLYSQLNPFLVKAAVLAQQFHSSSRTAAPVASRSATPTPFSSSRPIPSSNRQVFKFPDNIKKTNEQGLRILATDNGGICTFSTLYMLEVVMLEVGNILNVRPSNVFDLICGASTGGWIGLTLR